jgi:CheY-like chemotaxis protein
LTNDPIHVFVVDDQPFVASTLADILRLSGFSAIPFTNPREALQAARFDSPDLLISEIEMPKLSGIGLLDQARRIGHDFHSSQRSIGPRRFIAELRGVKREDSNSEIKPTDVPTYSRICEVQP